ncbi:hypothetical protein J6590_089335 [Homalodisca vitripennis]|nr:hypothetical protein J6590_089335 [Homalodisca vitripennis]
MGISKLELCHFCKESRETDIYIIYDYEVIAPDQVVSLNSLKFQTGGVQTGTGRGTRSESAGKSCVNLAALIGMCCYLDTYLSCLISYIAVYSIQIIAFTILHSNIDTGLPLLLSTEGTSEISQIQRFCL